MDAPTCHFHSLWLPPAEREPVALRLVPEAAAPSFGLATPAETTAQARALVGAVARAAVETLTGYRPLNQLTRWLEPAAVNGLALARRHGVWDGAIINRVRADPPGDGVIEGVAQVLADEHRLAIAIRLERRRGHWICTNLVVLLPGAHLRAC